jgi:hypothetical protein
MKKKEPIAHGDSFEVQRASMDDERFLEIVMTAVKEFEGDSTVLESAIGALAWGRVIGWQGIRLLHSYKAMTKYEKALGVKFRDELPPLTPHSRRMAGVRMMQGLGKFWKVVTAGMVPVREGKEASKSLVLE